MNDKRFELININGNMVEIDKGCVKLVTLFNDIGLETEFCCEGHDENEFYILFSNKVTDVDISNFIEGCSNSDFTLLLGTFSKWIRKCHDKIIMNWKYNATSINEADIDYKIILKKLNKIIDPTLLKDIQINDKNFIVRIVRYEESLSEARSLMNYLKQFIDCVCIYEDAETQGLTIQTHESFKTLNEAIKLRDYLEEKISEYV